MRLDTFRLTNNLADGVDEVEAVVQASNQSRAALAESEAALPASRNAERTTSQRAMHDQKTGLPNCTLFDDRQAQAHCRRRAPWPIARGDVSGLDRSKLVNDTNAHAAGDAVLTVVAGRLMRNARGEDTVCRNDGNEFPYLLINPSGREAVARVAGLIRQAIGWPVGLGALQFLVKPSIGIALYPERGTSEQTLIAHADAAMYRAKQLRSHCEFFEPSMASSTASRQRTH